MQLGTPKDRLDSSLADVSALLQKHRVLESLTHRQEGARKDLLERLQHQQNLVELQSRCAKLHPADMAYILESLPTGDRELVWRQTPAALKGAVLVEVADAVRASLLSATDRRTLVEALRALPADDLASLEGRINTRVWKQVWRELDPAKLTALQQATAYPDDVVGAVMRRDAVAIRDTATAAEALADLRSRGPLPAHLDLVCVVDVRNVLRGVITTADLATRDAGAQVAAVMNTDPVVFAADEATDAAVRAFERYDVVSAPIIDDRGKLVGRLTSDAVIDHIRAEADRVALAQAGLHRDEDLFAPVLDSARNRWLWLLVNLVTAFLASRVIGLFEDAIVQLVALAALMPIVASIGGNTGNQTVALVIRGLALNQLQKGAGRHLIRKELKVSLLNGLLWGSVMGVCAYAIYGSAALGFVMMAAMLLNLVVAAVVGVIVPVALYRAGRDPAHGASVLLTFVTDSMGFLLFLGLARVFLM
jgi:magnesium transporter